MCRDPAVHCNLGAKSKCVLRLEPFIHVLFVFPLLVDIFLSQLTCDHADKKTVHLKANA